MSSLNNFASNLRKKMEKKQRFLKIFDKVSQDYIKKMKSQLKDDYYMQRVALRIKRDRYTQNLKPRRFQIAAEAADNARAKLAAERRKLKPGSPERLKSHRKRTQRSQRTQKSEPSAENSEGNTINLIPDKVIEKSPNPKQIRRVRSKQSQGRRKHAQSTFLTSVNHRRYREARKATSGSNLLESTSRRSRSRRTMRSGSRRSFRSRSRRYRTRSPSEPRQRSRYHPDLDMKFEMLDSECEGIGGELRERGASRDFDIDKIKRRIGFGDLTAAQKERERDPAKETLIKLMVEEMKNVSKDPEELIKAEKARERVQSKFITTRLLEKAKIDFSARTGTLTWKQEVNL